MSARSGWLATTLVIVIAALVAYSALLNYANAKRAEILDQALNASVGASEQMLAMARARFAPDSSPINETIKRDLEALRYDDAFTTEAESESTTPLYTLLLARPEDPRPTWICKDRSTWGPQAEAWAEEFQAAATPYIQPFLEENAKLPTGVEASQLAELLRTNMELYIASKDYIHASANFIRYTKLCLRLQRQCAAGNSERMDIDVALGMFPLFARFVIAFEIDNPPKVNAIVDVLGEIDGMRTQVSAGLADLNLRNLIHIKDWEEETLNNAINTDGIWWGARNWLWVNACGPLFTNDVETYVRIAERTQQFKQSDFYVHGEEHAELLREVENLSEFYPISSGMKASLHALLQTYDMDADDRMLCVAAKVAMYRRHEGKFPTDLAALMGAKADKFVDPFTGHPFHLQTYGDSESFLLVSAGRDGRINTGDDGDYGWQVDPCAEWPHPKPKLFIKNSAQ